MIARHTTDEPIIALDATAGLCDVDLLERRGDHIMVTKAALAFHQMIHVAVTPCP